MSAYFDPVLFTVNLAVNLLLVGCLVAGGVVVSFRLIKNANPRLRYAVALTAFLFAALVPLAITFTGSVGSNEFIAAKNGGVGNSFNAAFSAQTVVAAPEIESPLMQPAPEEALNNFLNNFTAVVADSLLGKILFSLWILGAVGFILRDVLSLRQLKKARRLWREATDAERKELGFSDETPLYFGEESPATVGFFRPAIVLPKKFPDDLSHAQKRCVARHELSHARWRDPLVGFVLRLIRALFWISPALWLLERIAIGERESAADRFAVSNFSDDESEFEETALNYAATLVSVAKYFNFHARHKSFGANTIGFYNGSILENRVRRLLAHSPKTSVFHVFSAAAIFGSSLVGLFFMPIAFQSEAENFEAQATIVSYREADEAIQNENFNNLQTRNGQDESPWLKEVIKNRQTKVFAVSQNENQPESSPGVNKKTSQIPRVIMAVGKSVKISDGKAVDDSEDAIRKISEQDARAAGFYQKLDELSGKVQGLDAARKNLKSDVSQVRQKAASQIDSLMRQARTGNDPVPKSN